MGNRFSWFGDPSGLTPHGFCLSWRPELIWLHGVSDAVIGLAYYSIPVALIWFVNRRRDLAFSWIIALFAAFILACGTTHWLAILTLWRPVYTVEGLVKAATAVVSIGTAVVLWWLMPQALTLPSPEDLKRVNVALLSNQKFLNRTGALAGVGGWELDLVTNRVTWSDMACQLHDMPYGHCPTLEEGLSFYAPEARPTIQAAVSEGISNGASWDLELPMVSAKGRAFWARVVGLVEIEHGRPRRISGAIQEISVRKAMELELADRQELLEITLEAIGAAVGDAVITTDLAGRVRWVNSVAERLTGWPRAEAIGEHVGRIFVASGTTSGDLQQDPVTACLLNTHAADRGEAVQLLARDGAAYGIEDSAALISNRAGKPIGTVLVFRDVSEQRRLSEEMRRRATHDTLTGLKNRSEFELILGQMLEGAKTHLQTHALMYVDLDQFKLVNDTCGHAVGDQLLKQVASLVQSMVRSHDVVARLGGDEFGVLLGLCGVDHAVRVGEKICAHMEQFRFAHDGQHFQTGASIGLVAVDARWQNADALMKAADTACYGAKDAGRNRVHLWCEADNLVAERKRDMDWVNRLREAMDKNLFELFGQIILPLTPLSSGLRFETLLRLHSDSGVISGPGVFMLAAERFNLAARIDRWVLQNIFAWIEGIGDKADAIDLVTINVSGQSLGDRAFHRDLMEMISCAKFDVSKVCLEITETSAITNFADAIRLVEEVRSVGLQIALDDFGAGSSSFGYLKLLPVDYLKIDGQFIKSLLEDKVDQAAVRCFRDVAKATGVTTIAEHVETEAVRDELRRMGIDMIQGYLVHEPETIDAMLMRALSNQKGGQSEIVNGT